MPCPLKHDPPQPNTCHLCKLFTTREDYNKLWGGSGIISYNSPATFDKTIPCQFLGPETGEQVKCNSCHGNAHIKLFSCSKHGECTLRKELPNTKCCKTNCLDYKPDRAQLISPRRNGAKLNERPWEGKLHKKPWQYKITAIIPHLDTIELLKLSIELLRLQTVRPYLLIIDTGSPDKVCEQLEELRHEDLEVHYVKSHGWIHSSEPVSIAQDLGMALCRSEYLFCTHADVFLRRKDFLEWCLKQNASVVGYEMSPRSGTEKWRGVPSHTATLLHMPTMHRHGVSWSLQRWYAINGIPKEPTVGWPDTESMFGESLKAAGLKPFFITPGSCPGAKLETNYQRHVDINLDHARSLPGLRVYEAGTERHKRAESYAKEAMAEARQRIQEWTNPVKVEYHDVNRYISSYSI